MNLSQLYNLSLAGNPALMAPMAPRLPLDLVRGIQRLASPVHDTDQAVAVARGMVHDELPMDVPGRFRDEGGRSIPGTLDEQVPPAAQAGEPVSPQAHQALLELARLDPKALDYFVKRGIESELSGVSGFKQGIAPAEAGKPRLGVDPELEFNPTMQRAFDEAADEAEPAQGMNVRSLDAERRDNATMGRFGLPSHADLEAMGLPGEARDYMTDEELKRLPAILKKLNGGEAGEPEVTGAELSPAAARGRLEPGEEEAQAWNYDLDAAEKFYGGRDRGLSGYPLDDRGYIDFGRGSGNEDILGPTDWYDEEPPATPRRGVNPVRLDEEPRAYPPISETRRAEAASRYNTKRSGLLNTIKQEKIDKDAERLLADEDLDLRGSAAHERASDLAYRSGYIRPAREQMAKERGARSLDDMRTQKGDEKVSLPKEAGRKAVPAREKIAEGKYERSSPVNPKRLHDFPDTPQVRKAIQAEGTKSVDNIDRARARKGQSDLTEDFARAKASSIANERSRGYHQWFNKDTSFDNEVPPTSPPSQRLVDLAEEDRAPRLRQMRRNPSTDFVPKAEVARRSQEATDISRPDPRALQNTAESRLQAYRRNVNAAYKDELEMGGEPHIPTTLSGYEARMPRPTRAASEVFDIETVGGHPVHLPSGELTHGEMAVLNKEPRSYRNLGGGDSNPNRGGGGPSRTPETRSEYVQRRTANTRAGSQARKGKFQEYAERKFGKGY